MQEENPQDFRVQEMESENQALRRQLSKHETKSRKKDVIIREIRKESAEKSKRIEYHESLWDTDVLERGGSARYMHSQYVINAVMNDPDEVRNITHHTIDQLRYVYRKAEEAVRKDGSRMFYENGDPRPGNRTKLTVRQSVFVSLAQKAGALKQAAFVMVLGTSQSTVSRCIAYIDPILDEVLPTAKKVQKAVMSATTDEELEKLVPGGIIIPDGTETPKQRPGNNEVQKEYYSGKKKRHTVKNTVITNIERLFLYLGPAQKGKMHDLSMLREEDPDLGLITDRAKSHTTPRDKRPVILSDLGYKKIQEHYPGATHKQPHKKPHGGELTKRQKQDNRAISKKRIRVEHAIGKLKRYAVLATPFDGTVKRFDLTISVLSGLANLKTLWNHRKKKPKREF